MYKLNIVKGKKGFRAQFVHKNGQVIFWTESYSGKAAAKNAVKKLQENASKAEVVEVDETVKKVAAKAPAKKAAKKAAPKAKKTEAATV